MSIESLADGRIGSTVRRISQVWCGMDLGHYWKRLANREVECCKCGKVASPALIRKLKRKGYPG